MPDHTPSNVPDDMPNNDNMPDDDDMPNYMPDHMPINTL